jgi:hypothetical protein
MTPNLNKALSIAQGKFSPLHYNSKAKVVMKSGGSYEFQYADLNAVLDSTRPALIENGLSWSTRCDGNLIHVDLRHESGEMITSSLPIRIPDRPQELGSLLTYYKRYLICGLLGLSAEEDDDGNMAEGNEAKIDRKPVGNMSTVDKKPVSQAVKSLDKPAAKTKATFEPPKEVKARLLEKAMAMKVPFGKTKGTELGNFDSNELLSARDWAKSVGKFQDFIDAATLILENRKDEGDLDQALAGNKPDEGDMMPVPPDWMTEEIPF